MATIIINGNTFDGKSIHVVGSHVIIDGQKSCDLNEISGKELNITVNGDIEELHVDCCKQVNVTGSVSDLTTQSGDVKVQGGVIGDIQTTSGGVNVHGDVNRNVSTISGNVKCVNVGGNVRTVSGDISRN